MTEREQSLKLIREAYENKELGFQKGAKTCLYYDSKTDSCCAVGVLVKNERLFDSDGDQEYAFRERQNDPSIEDCMDDLDMKEYKGLTLEELTRLQSLHDRMVAFYSETKEKNFKDYLYSL